MQLKRHTCNLCGGTCNIPCLHCNRAGGYNSGSRLGEYHRDHNYVYHGDTLWINCSMCHGSGHLSCHQCHGLGTIEVYE